MSERPDETVIENPAGAAPAASEPVSLRSALEAGFAADAARSAAEPGAEIKPATIPDPAAPPAQAQPRGEDGKFAPKDPAVEAAKPAAPETKITDSPEAARPEAQAEPIQPPAALSAAVKSIWSTLPPVAQAEWSKRETEMVQGLQKSADMLKPLQAISEAIEPHRNYLAINKMDPATYVRSLVAADELLRGPNPLDALAQIAGMYNIDLRQLGQPAPQAQPGQQPVPQAQPDPLLQQALKEIADLKQTVTQQQSVAQETEQTQTKAQIDAFAKDHLYFENVRPEMAALLRAGTATDMASAYDMACWARPDIRPLLMKEQADKAASAARAEASAKVNDARQASGSVTGSPTPGAAPAQTGPAPSIRESLERQFGAAA